MEDHSKLTLVSCTQLVAKADFICYNIDSQLVGYLLSELLRCK